MYKKRQKRKIHIYLQKNYNSRKQQLINISYKKEERKIMQRRQYLST